MEMRLFFTFTSTNSPPELGAGKVPKSTYPGGLFSALTARPAEAISTLSGSARQMRSFIVISGVNGFCIGGHQGPHTFSNTRKRSEERRVGKECRARRRT